MPADGLTKALPAQKHATFVQQLNLIDILKKLEGNHSNNVDGKAITPENIHRQRAAISRHEEEGEGEGEEEGGRFAYSGVF
jgi:hypothetical protein